MSRRARQRAAAVAVKRLSFVTLPDDDRHLEDDEADGLDWLADDDLDAGAPHYLSTYPAPMAEGRIA